MALVLGVGPGTFAVLVAFGVSILISLVGATIQPNRAALIVVASLALPLIVFGLISAAPQWGAYDNLTKDNYYPGRITLFLVLSLGVILAILAQQVLPVFWSPKYTAPRQSCRRAVLKANHPTWVQ